MGNVWYIAETLTEEAPDGIACTERGSDMHSRLKIEETAYDSKTKVRKLRLALQTRGNMTWNNVDSAYYYYAKISVNGTELLTDNWTVNTRQDDANTWTDIRTIEVTLAAGATQCTVDIGLAESTPYEGAAYAGFTLYYYYTSHGYTYFGYAKKGVYVIDFAGAGAKTGGAYIGGAKHGIYIGNGTGFDRYEAYIGENGAWKKMR